MVYDNIVDKKETKQVAKIKINKAKKITPEQYHRINAQLQSISNQRETNSQYIIDRINEANSNINELENNIKEKSSIREEEQKKYKVKQIKQINKIQLKNAQKIKISNQQKEKSSLEREKIEQLEKEIINRIKKDLVHSINEYEILQSELYVLSCIDSNDIELKKCQENIKEIKKLLSKVKSLKEKYDYLKDNVDFEYLMSIDDSFLVDKIIELKNICSYDTLNTLSKDYKLLDEYKYLYLKIDKLHSKTNELEEKKKKKEEELKQRDIDYEKFKNKIYDINKINDNFNTFAIEQNKILNELNANVNKISQEELTNYRLKGLGKLLTNSFKYIGLVMASPLKGIIPGIATQTVITKNVVQNLYHSMGYEEVHKTLYHAMDYSSVINNAINDLDYTNMEIDNTLSNIIALKAKYKESFQNYSSDIPEYRDTIRKLNKIENSVMNTKIKLDIIRERMKEKEKENKNTMIKVRKLNDKEEYR